MAPGFPSLKEVNPEAARLLELLRAPKDKKSSVRPRKAPLRPKAHASSCWPGLAEALESHAPSGDFKAVVPRDDEASDDEVERVMAATAPLMWRPQALQASDQEWYTRHAAAVPPLPNWLRRQICRASESAKQQRASTPPPAPKEAMKVELPPKVRAGHQGQRRGAELVHFDHQDVEDEEGAARRRVRRMLVKLRGQHNVHEDEPQHGQAVFEELPVLEDLPEEQAEEEGSIFKGGRLQNVEKKRNVAFKEIMLKSDKKDRVQRLNHRRKQMYKGNEEEESSGEEYVEPRRSSQNAAVRKPPATADTAEGQLLLEAFRRYDREDEGVLGMSDVRACLADIGIHPTLPPEKRAVTEVLQSAGPMQNGLDFYVIAGLVPKIWEAMSAAKRQDLEYWFSRSLDENGIYDLQELRPCLEALGLRIHDEEWMEVERIFIPMGRDKKPQKTLPKSVTKILFEQKMRKAKGPDKSPVHTSDISDFDFFQKSFRTVQEHLTRRRRRLERQLCEEHQLTHEQVEEFRADLVPLDFLFRRFDRHARGLLSEKEVMNLLVACGADARLLRSDFMPHLIREGCYQARVASKGRSSLLQAKPLYSATIHSAGWKKVQKATRKGWKPSVTQLDFLLPAPGSQDDVNFFQFLYVMKFLREQSREVQLEELRRFYHRLEQDEVGDIAIKEAMRLFPELGLSPRSRGEQLEIKQVLNEVDEDGTGTLSWDEFTQVVLLCQERLERLNRQDEDLFAQSLGFTLERCRELRKLFLDSKNDFNVLEVPELRRAMTTMQRMYKSEELLLLFNNFARHGFMDFRCFLRMMQAIEIQKTEGQLWDKKKVPRRTLVSSNF